MASSTSLSQGKQQINVDIVSDFACPWCLVGRKKLEKAMDELNSEFSFQVRWKPFLIRPDTPQEGGAAIPVTTTMKEKIQRLREAAKEVGLKLKARDPIRIPYTLQAHMLMQYVELKGFASKQDEIAETLLKAFFLEGKIYDTDLLMSVASKAGVEVEGLKEYLENLNIAEEVKNEALSWSRKGISGVPFFIFNGVPSFSGAQDPNVFKQTILKIARRRPVGNSKDQSSSANL